MAATKLRIRLAARCQRSSALSLAFSVQLLNEHREHAFDFDGLLGQVFVVIGRDQFQISSQQKLVFQFAGRASGDSTEADNSASPSRPQLFRGLKNSAICATFARHCPVIARLFLVYARENSNLARPLACRMSAGGRNVAR